MLFAGIECNCFGVVWWWCDTPAHNQWSLEEQIEGAARRGGQEEESAAGAAQSGTGVLY